VRPAPVQPGRGPLRHFPAYGSANKYSPVKNCQRADKPEGLILLNSSVRKNVEVCLSDRQESFFGAPPCCDRFCASGLSKTLGCFAYPVTLYEM